MNSCNNKFDAIFIMNRVSLINLRGKETVEPGNLKDQKIIQSFIATVVLLTFLSTEV